jgi:hypothetical protein
VLNKKIALHLQDYFVVLLGTRAFTATKHLKMGKENNKWIV